MRNSEAEPIQEVDKRETLFSIHNCFYEIASEMYPDPDAYCKILIELQKMGFSFQDILLWQEFHEAIDIYLSDIL